MTLFSNLKTLRSPRSLANLALVLVACSTVRPAWAQSSFAFTARAAGPSSAGIYDARGRLVRVLWTRRETPPGPGKGEWDGKDDLGNTMPAGSYTFKVAVNHSTYKNVGVIGNTANPPTTSGHVPTNFEAVAVDAAGFAYTVHDWNEPHFDIIKWDPATGRSVYNSGHVVGDLLKAIAVEPDGSYAYVSSYSNIRDRTKARFAIWRVKLAPGATALAPFTVAGKSIDVYNGNAAYPAGSSVEDQAVMMMPLLSLAVGAKTLYATDSLGGRVLAYDKVTGELQKSFPVRLPQSVAIGAGGQLWVAHQGGRVSLLDADGRIAATPIDGLKNINAIAYSKGLLYVSDQALGQVKVYKTEGETATLQNTFGDKARPGDRAAHRFIRLHGLAVDSGGNMLVASNGYFFNDGRLAKFSPTFAPLWQQMGLEFQSIGNYGAADPDTFYSVMHHAYKLDRTTGSAKFLGGTFEDTGYRSGAGNLRAVTLGGREFVFMANGDGVAAYRVMPPADKFRGPSLRLSALVAGSSPRPDGAMAAESWKPENYYLWSWSDDKGDGIVRPEQQSIFQKPEDKNAMFQHQTCTVDEKGNIWFSGSDWGSGRAAGTIIVIPLVGLNKIGNPIYEWKNARVVVSRKQFTMGRASEETKLAVNGSPVPETTPSQLTAGPKMIQTAADGSIYAYADTRDKRAPQDGGLHMGGNVLARFTLAKGAKLLDEAVQLPTKPYAPLPDVPDLAEQQWMIVLPKKCVGMDLIPPGATGNDGVMIGGNPWRGAVHHYTRDGLLIGEFFSDEDKFGGKANKNHPSGLMDTYGALAVNRDPRDGILDVFVEDDFNLRIFWYRVDDRDIEMLQGKLAL